LPYCIGRNFIKTINIKVLSEFKNNNSQKPLNILRRIRTYLSIERKKQLIFVLFLSLLTSIAESISIAALIPFVSFFISPENYLFNSYFKLFFEVFNISDRQSMLNTVSLIFVAVVLLSGFLKIQYLKMTSLVTEKTSSDFRIKIFSFLINQDINYYFKRGSNEILSNLSQKTESFTIIIFSAINIINSIFLTIAIVAVLIFNEPFFTPIIITSIILFFIILFKIKAKTVLQKSEKISLNLNTIIDIFENTIGYLPEIIIYNFKKFYTSYFNKVSEASAQSGAEIRTIKSLPRIYLETFVIVFVVLLVSFSDFTNRAIEINLSYLAILAFGAQKILPQINSVYSLAIGFKSATPNVLAFLNILDEDKKELIEEKDYKILNFKKSIILEKLSFQYDKNSPKIFDNINFEIIKGEKIAIKGETGSGKSTLINVISSLLDPSSGNLLVDGIKINSTNKKNWQKNISIVPQVVFLNDATIFENIAIGLNLNEIDIGKAKKSAKLAYIENFIESLPNKYNEKVGERGVRLSGGQRQRIGIARALYRSSNLLILDEPTNALDLEHENLVMDSLSKLNSGITIIMISHSNNSLKYFDKIIDLNKFK
jgi:ABC-type multidrug transport system fused ATPase/permease subunit